MNAHEKDDLIVEMLLDELIAPLAALQAKYDPTPTSGRPMRARKRTKFETPPTAVELAQDRLELAAVVCARRPLHSWIAPAEKRRLRP